MPNTNLQNVLKAALQSDNTYNEFIWYTNIVSEILKEDSLPDLARDVLDLIIPVSETITELYHCEALLDGRFPEKYNTYGYFNSIEAMTFDFNNIVHVLLHEVGFRESADEDNLAEHFKYMIENLPLETFTDYMDRFRDFVNDLDRTAAVNVQGFEVENAKEAIIEYRK